MIDRSLTVVVTLVLVLLIAPLAPDAQQARKVPRIGVLTATPEQSPRAEAFRQGLRELGWVEGQNIVIEWRWPQGRPERYPALAAEIVRLKVDVIVAGSDDAVQAAQKAVGTIPIVMVHSTDPVGLGFIASLARPGGNITGLTNQATELQGKRLQLLKEAVPNLSRAAVLWDPTEAPRRRQVREAEIAAQALRVPLQILEARNPGELESAFAAMTREGVSAVWVHSTAMLLANRARIAELARQSRLPTMCGAREYVEAGCVMSYNVNFVDLHRRAAYFVAKILKGAKPADLPVEQPTKFELVINLQTARALGLTIPPLLLLRADQVIE
jgi:putative ABC transport system substrate-binding protein